MISGARTPAALLLVMVTACAPDPGSDELRLAAHGFSSYTWTASSCRSGAGLFGPSCDDETVAVRDVDIEDPAVVEVVEVGGPTIELFSGEPGFSEVVLDGDDRDVMVLDIEVVTPTVEFDAFFAEPSPLILRGGVARVDYVLVDDLSRSLLGVAAVEIEAQGLAGVVVEPIADENAVWVRVPDKVGAFRLAPMERGVPFRLEVLDPGDVDGIAVESFDVYSDVREIVPTVAGVPLRAGPMPYAIEPVDPNAACEIDARDWGEPPVEGADTPPATWGVRLTGEPCELRITLPAAARGAGLEDVIAWPT